MRSIDWKRGILSVPLVTAGMAVFACGGGASQAPVAASPATTSTPAASVAAAPSPPATVPPAAPTAAAAPAPEDTSAQEDEAAGAELSDHHRHHHHGGVAAFIAMSLDTVGVTPEQHAAVEKIQGALHAKLEPSRAAEGKLHALLADEIAAGHVDKAKIDKAVADLATASGGLHAAITDSLNELHSVLNEAQRAALVEKVEAHWQVWKEANAEGPESTDPHGHGHLEALATDLALTPEQVEKIRSSLHTSSAGAHEHLDAEKVAAHIKAFGTAFESPTFDAKALKSGDAVNAHLARFGAARMARFYEAVVPVLTPEQRTKLADRVREHGNHQETPAAG